MKVNLVAVLALLLFVITAFDLIQIGFRFDHILLRDQTESLYAAANAKDNGADNVLNTKLAADFEKITADMRKDHENFLKSIQNHILHPESSQTSYVRVKDNGADNFNPSVPALRKARDRPRLLILQLDNRGYDDKPKNLYMDEQNMMSRQPKFHYKTGFWVHTSVLMSLYAKHHNFKYVRVIPDKLENPEYNPQWDKVVVLHEALDKYPDIDYIWYLDADAVVEEFDVNLLDFLESEKVGLNSFVACFHSNHGLGTGEMIFKNDRNARSILQQWRNSIRNGLCAVEQKTENNADQPCFAEVFKSNSSVHKYTTKAPNGLFTRRFVRHCGGGGKEQCIRRNVYMNLLRRLNIDVVKEKQIWDQISKWRPGKIIV